MNRQCKEYLENILDRRVTWCRFPPRYQSTNLTCDRSRKFLDVSATPSMTLVSKKASLMLPGRCAVESAPIVTAGLIWNRVCQMFIVLPTRQSLRYGWVRWHWTPCGLLRTLPVGGLGALQQHHTAVDRSIHPSCGADPHESAIHLRVPVNFDPRPRFCHLTCASIISPYRCSIVLRGQEYSPPDRVQSGYEEATRIIEFSRSAQPSCDGELPSHVLGLWIFV